MGAHAVRTARFPPSWPAEMRADVAAAFFDYGDTKSFFTAVSRGEAPRPTARRGTGPRAEPIWARSVCEHFLEHSTVSRTMQRMNKPPASWT